MKAKNIAEYARNILSIVTLLVVVITIMVVSGCAMPNKVIKTIGKYNPDESAFIHEKGSTIVEGQAFLRTTIGEVRTCAGAEVSLTPNSSYARERMRNLYGSVIQGRNNTNRIDEPDPRYLQDAMDTTCDAEGDFRFTDVPPGQYFVTTEVWWQIPQRYINSWEGANLMKRIQVTGTEDEPIRVLLH